MLLCVFLISGIKRFQGIAGSCSTAKLHAETIIDYLKSSDYNPKRDGNWLDAVLYAIFHNGYGKGPSHIHTAAQFAVYTGELCLRFLCECPSLTFH